MSNPMIFTISSLSHPYLIPISCSSPSSLYYDGEAEIYMHLMFTKISMNSNSSTSNNICHTVLTQARPTMLCIPLVYQKISSRREPVFGDTMNSGSFTLALTVDSGLLATRQPSCVDSQSECFASILHICRAVCFFVGVGD